MSNQERKRQESIMKKSFKLLTVLFAVLFNLTACDDEPELPNDPEGSTTSADQHYTQQLKNTAWMTKSTVFYNANDVATSSYDNTTHPDYITFKDTKYYSFSNEYYTAYLDLNKSNNGLPGYTGYTKTYNWRVKDGVLDCHVGSSICFGEILSLTSNELRTKYYGTWSDGNLYRIDTYSRVPEPTHKFDPNTGSGSGNEGEDGGSSSSYEKPDISFYDYTATTKSIKIQYRIWNKSECGNLSSAKIYYGTSSAARSVSATILGQYIVATISGLSSGTDYYVKCSVKGSAGTTTTDETRVATLY